jgi:anaerobic glycerol-3-phosphate dehydrogenase
MSAPARLTANDHAALHEAAALVQAVCDRHPHEMRLPIFDHLRTALREIGVIEALLDAA